MRRALLCLALAVGAPALGRPVEWIVAVVNHEVITQTEVEEALRAAAARLGRSVEELPAGESGRLRDQVLESLVEERLLVQEARRRGIAVEAEEVRRETEETIENLKAAFASEAEFKRALAQEFLTEEALYERYRGEVEERLLRDRLVDEAVRSKVRVDPQDVRRAYENRRRQIRARHILVSTEAEARDVLRRLEGGEDFADLARRVSLGPAAARGGDLGLLARGQTEPAFEEAAFGAEPGRFAGPVRTRYGWHVIQVLERTDVDLPPLTPDLENRLRAEVFARRAEERLRAFVEDLKGEAYIEVRDAPPTSS